MAEIAVHDFLPLLATLRTTPEHSLWVTYDGDADVLYVNFRRPSEATDSELTDDDVIVRYDGDELAGFTVLHASRRGPNDEAQLLS